MSTGSVVVLLSGGIDSISMLSLTMAYGWSPICLGVAWGQTNSAELETAYSVAKYYDCEYVEVGANISRLADAPLTSRAAPTPGPRTLSEIREEQVSPWEVPMRNATFLSLAAALARSRGIGAVMIGATLDDHGGFEDCRKSFFDAFESMSAAAGSPVTVMAPLLSMRKQDVIWMADQLDAPIANAISCYHPQRNLRGQVACGRCDACIVRIEGFEAAGIDDPAEYLRPA